MGPGFLVLGFQAIGVGEEGFYATDDFLLFFNTGKIYCQTF